jgi:hypothetical protein
MSELPKGERLRDIEAAGQVPPATRLLRLHTRASRLQQNEAYWSVAEPLEAILAAGDALLKAAPDAAVLEALDGIFEAASLLLDGVE